MMASLCGLCTISTGYSVPQERVNPHGRQRAVQSTWLSLSFHLARPRGVNEIEGGGTCLQPLVMLPHSFVARVRSAVRGWSHTPLRSGLPLGMREMEFSNDW